MYVYFESVYGIPYSEDLEKEAKKLGIDILDDLGFETVYYERLGVGVGRETDCQAYLGKRLDSHYTMNIQKVEEFPEPTPQQKKEVDETYRNLPEEIRKVADEPSVILVFGTS